MTEFLNRFEISEEKDGSTIIFYLNPETTEFSTEFLASLKNQKETIEGKVNELLKEKLPGVKASAVKVVVGSMIITTIPLYTEKASAHNVENFNMSYIYFGNPNTHVSYVERTQGNLQVISPSYFDINPDGSLKLTRLVNSAFIEEMHGKGVKVVPFLSNHWDRASGRAALENREKLAQDIANAIETYNLDGVNVDIENVTDVDRENYTDLVRLLREKIPAHKEVSVAVAANPNGWNAGWHGSYDYHALSQYADYLMIMAYDESYTGGPEGPVASLPWVKRSIEYAINKGVPKDKIVLGIPFFGRYWVEGQAFGGYGISNNRVEELINLYESTVTYDEKAQSPKATIIIKDTDPTYNLAGRILGPGTYHIWYENEQSIKAKVDLVHEYEIKGTGSWALGQENNLIWQNYGEWLKGHTATTELKTPEVQPSYTNYTVKSGDSLSSIALRHGTTVAKIKEVNGLTSDLIKIGQTLKIPNSQAAGTTTPINDTTPDIVRGPRGEIGHVQVKKRINLWKRDANGKLEFVRILNPGESYRVYKIDSRYGGQYDVGGNHWITNMPDHVTYQPLTQTTQNDITVVRGPKGEIGHIRILKPINLWQRDANGKLLYSRVLKPGEVYRVYSNDEKYGGQFGVGGNHWITNMKGYVSYEPLQNK
ncbi:LysM peptidoglycan-binding domain-containing protein [Bacillus luteolus]|uniref:LysM peptidoglycan-binding domain-containing protein n=1 Tax=Litchfieldia luteola TaxID=682179 RepID=A0ABR9QF75_9BACI|nr:glycosyl hydrolase family 18 protein [Cytobacillus luteolus]MBE4907145.1 LysM peptidoglycan-binding domain-containing protein [Cytobacillus luteolus]MBP1943385.1 spore germination protein YaaH [Cytobacillus luteolus]